MTLLNILLMISTISPPHFHIQLNWSFYQKRKSKLLQHDLLLINPCWILPSNIFFSRCQENCFINQLGCDGIRTCRSSGRKVWQHFPKKKSRLRDKTVLSWMESGGGDEVHGSHIPISFHFSLATNIGKQPSSFFYFYLFINIFPVDDQQNH